MQTKLTDKISSLEAQNLDGLCASAGKSRSEVVREALRAYCLRESLRQSQTELAPLAKRSGWLTEEDILQDAAIN